MNDKSQNQLMNAIYSKIKQISELLKISIEKNNIRQVLKCINEILLQLKTELLSPQLYNQLFIYIFDQILLVQVYLRNEIKKGRNSLSLYSSVQQCINALPRAYLMIIVGSIILENNLVDKKDLLEDLLEACNHIKYPLKGLFLRYFLLKVLNKYFNDLDLLMINLKEMNKLWINVNKMKNINDKAIKQYRNNLKVLIGENITNIANTFNKIKNENNENIYKEKILIPFLSIVKTCKDRISQEFILLCLIQVFNEEYNIKFINEIINALIEIKENIDIKFILSDIMEKLSKFKDIEKIKEKNMNNIFEKINECIMASIDKKIENIKELENTNEKNTSLNINDSDIISLIETQHSFIKFINNFGSGENIKEVFDILNNSINKIYELLSCVKSFNKEKNNILISNYALNSDNIKIIFDLLNEFISNPILISEFSNFPNLMKFLNNTYFYELSLSILDNIANSYNLGKINTSEKCKKLLEFIEPINLNSHTKLTEYLSNKLIYKLAKIVFIPCSKDPYEQLDMLQMIKNFLINSTKNDNEPLTEKKKLIFLSNCLNAMILLGLNIIESYENIKNKKTKKVKTKLHLDFCNNYNFTNKKFDINKERSFLSFFVLLFKEIDSIFEQIKYISSEITFKLYIEVLKMINAIKFEDFDKYEEYAFNYISNALDLLKDDKNKKEENANKEDNAEIIKIDASKKYNYLVYLIGAFSYIEVLNEEHYNHITEEIEKLCEQLPKQNERCLLMLKCINFYCNENEADTNKILELFSKAKKYAIYSMINPENTILFVHILNEYFRLDGFIKCLDKTIKINDIEEIIETIETYLNNMKRENKDINMIKYIENYYNNTINTIKMRQKDRKGKIYKLIANLKFD